MIIFRNFTHINTTLQFICQHTDIVRVIPPSILLNATNKSSYNLQLEALGAGNSEVYANISVPDER